MKKAFRKTPVKIALAATAFVIVGIAAFYIVLESKYQHAVHLESEQEYAAAYNEIEAVGFYRDVKSRFADNPAFLLNYALETSDFSVLEPLGDADKITLPSLIGCDAGIAACALNHLDIPCEIKYEDNAAFTCNAVVDQSAAPGTALSKGGGVVLHANGYWGTCAENIAFAHAGIGLCVAESGEWLYYIDGAKVVRCRFDFSDQSVIYQDNSSEITLIQASRGYVFLLDLNNTLTVISPDNTVMHGESQVMDLIVLNNAVYYKAPAEADDIRTQIWYRASYKLEDPTALGTGGANLIVYNGELCFVNTGNRIEGLESGTVYARDLLAHSDMKDLLEIGPDLFTLFEENGVFYVYRNEALVYQTAAHTPTLSYTMASGRVFVANLAYTGQAGDSSGTSITVYDIENGRERSIERPKGFEDVFNKAGDYLFSNTFFKTGDCLNIQKETFVEYREL